MKYFHVVILFGVVSSTASAAWAQYGLYGSPEMLQLPAVESLEGPQYAPPGTLAAPVQPAPGAPFPGSPSRWGVCADAIPCQRSGPAMDSTAHLPPQSAYSGQLLPGTAGRPRKERRDAPRKRAQQQTPAPEKAPALEPPRPRGPSVVEQMLEEAAAYPATEGCTPAGEFGTLCEADACDPCQACFDPPWYVAGSWLIMGRNQPNRLWTTYETNNNANQLMNTRDIELRWGNGGQIRFGRRFCLGRWALEATYWGLEPLRGFASMTHASMVSTPLSFMDVVYADPLIPGLPVDLFDGADEHRLYRENEFHNVEVSLIRGRIWSEYGDWLDIGCSLGVRYFRFEESLTFASLDAGGSWGNPADVGYLDDRIQNNLIGFQIGCDVGCHVYRNVRVFLGPKVGIYGNHIENRFRAFRGDGELFAPDPASGVPGSYPVNSNESALSFLTEIDLGLDWQISRNWTAFVGYRVIVATGVGLADNQFPPYVVDIPEIADIDYNGELVLHGAFAGAVFNF